MNGGGANVAGCGHCGGKCCRMYRVGVNIADVWRIADGTALHPREFITLTHAEGNGFRLKRYGSHQAFLLQRRPENNACVFLMEIAENRARCGVYAHRPRVCSNFPTALKNGAITIREGTACGDNSWNLAGMDLPAYRRGHTEDKAGWERHREVVEAWNEMIDASDKEATEDELFDFLMSYRESDASA